MRIRLRFAVFFILSVLLIAPIADSKKWETGFLDRTIKVQGVTYKYQVYVPENWSPNKKWAVILFLHGVGERADDGLIQTEVGIGRAIREHRDRFPSIVVMPQCPAGDWWVQPSMDEVAITALEEATREFRGDRNRTYLTGLSMGAYETWHLAQKYPGRFAAIAPICGGILTPEESRSLPANNLVPYAEAAKMIGGKTPTWIFHGANDHIVPVAESRRMNAAMRNAGAEVRYTEYPDIGHDCWKNAYDDPDLLTWMLSKSLSGNAAAKK